jgi:dethiobiotin synthetase
MTARGLFVTGTDTGVGKTEVAAGLLRAFAARGFATVGMKPVAAGCRRQGRVLVNADVTALQSAGNVRAPRGLVNPYAFRPPIAPHIAAEAVGVEIDLRTILAGYRALATRADVVVVEGVGGFVVPLAPRLDTAELARRLRLPVVLVVGMRLGCLNHALLTAEAVRARGLVLAGWVANRVAPSMRAYRSNVRALEDGLGAPLLGEVPHRAGTTARRSGIDAVLDVEPLLRTVNEQRARTRS